MEYVVVKTQEVNPKINSPEWEKANTGTITQCSQWNGYFPCPNTTFKMLYSDAGISILMHTDETHLRAEATTFQVPVCHDSCMEFFFKPDPYDKRYINFEVNPIGVMHIGLGSDRYDRVKVTDDRAILDIESVAKEGDWTIKYFLPYEFLRRFFNQISPVSRGNFYKCGEKTDHSHTGAWAKVETPVPDFHVPDFFDKIRFGNGGGEGEDYFKVVRP